LIAVNFILELVNPPCNFGGMIGAGKITLINNIEARARRFTGRDHLLVALRG